MKKIIAIFLIMSLLSCTGCSNSENNYDKSGETISEGRSEITDSATGSNSPIGGESTVTGNGNVKTVTENYDADFESCQKTSYVNLDWTNAGKCPVNPASELFNITCQNQMATDVMSQKEMLVKFEEYCRFYFGEYDDEYAFFQNEPDKGEEILPDLGITEINGIPYSSYYKISDYKKKLENEVIKINYLAYRNLETKQYLWWVWNDYPHWINKGGALTTLNDDSIRCSSWIPSDLGEPIARYYNDGKSNKVKYKLTDGEVSIGEAIKYFTEEYPQTLPCENKPVYSVNYVDVFELGNGNYCYLMHAAKLFNSVAFEQIGELSGTNIPNYYTDDSQALMIKRNDIDVTLDCDPGAKVEREGDAITNIVSLKKAADIASEKMSQNVMFDVQSTEFVYHGAIDSENIAHLKPTWRFVLHNENDSMNYNVYVDAVSGDCNYFSYVSM